MVSKILSTLMLVLGSVVYWTEGWAIGKTPQFKSDAIETHWPDNKNSHIESKDENDDPGFMKRQLRRFGEMASKIGNSVGSGASTITNAIDKVCEVVKTVIPLLTAVCHVGQFKFCTATMGAPEGVNQALSTGYKDLNLNMLD